MRTRVIPAQITTVEDKIAGSLNVTQLLLLMVPVIFSTTLFIFLPPKLHVDLLKFVFSAIVFLLSTILAFRFKGKVIINWLAILTAYNLRPKYYLLDKNSSHLRTMYQPIFKKTSLQLLPKAKYVEKVKQKVPSLPLGGLVQLEQLITDTRFSFSLKAKKKGELYVGLEQIRQ